MLQFSTIDFHFLRISICYVCLSTRAGARSDQKKTRECANVGVYRINLKIQYFFSEGNSAFEKKLLQEKRACRMMKNKQNEANETNRLRPKTRGCTMDRPIGYLVPNGTATTPTGYHAWKVLCLTCYALVGTKHPTHSALYAVNIGIYSQRCHHCFDKLVSGVGTELYPIVYWCEPAPRKADAPIHTLTYGILPIYDVYWEAYYSLCPDRRFTFVNDKRVGTDSYTCDELWAELRKATSEGDDGLDWCSAVLACFGIEWV